VEYHDNDVGVVSEVYQEVTLEHSVRDRVKVVLGRRLSREEMLQRK